MTAGLTDLRMLAVLIAAPLILLASVLWQRALVLLIPLAVGLNGVPLVLGTTNVRAEQVIAVLLSLTLGVSVLIGRRRLYLDRTALWLGAVAFLHFLASALFSPARSYSLQQTASLAAVWAIYLVVTNYVNDESSLRNFFRVTMAAGFLYAGIGILAFLIGTLGYPVAGANTDPNDTIAYGSYGTMYEPNIYGSYCAVFLVLALGAIVLRSSPGEIDRTPGDSWAWPLLIVAGMGLLLSFTRGAWLATLAAVVILLLAARRYYGRRIRLRPIVLSLAVVATFAVGLWFLPFEGAEFFRYKVRNFVNSQSGNAMLRLLTYGIAFEQFTQHPILGWGTYTFAPLTVEGLPFKEFEGWHGLWLGNVAVQVLHDTGIVGFVAYAAMLWSLTSTALRRTRAMAPVDAPFAARHLGVLVAFVTLLVASIFTTAFTLGYAWMFAGLVGAFSRVSAERLAWTAMERA